MDKKREIKWWEISTGDGVNWTKKESMRAEMNEILDEYRWEMNLLKRTPFDIYRNTYRLDQDIKDFWEKYSELKENA